MDEFNLVETHESRMNEIQDLSDVVAIANLQLNKLMKHLEWSRKEITNEKLLVRCNFDLSHRVSSVQANDHNILCSLRYYGFGDLKVKDITPSSLFFYEGTNVVPVELGQDIFDNLGVKSFKVEQKNVDEQKSLIEKNEDINFYKPCNALDELRFIYSWVKIPITYSQLNVEKVPADILYSFLQEKLNNMKRYSFSVEKALILLTNWLKESINPDKFTEQAKIIFNNEAETFVLDLWKFVYAKSLCISNNISEHTRKEFQSLSSVRRQDNGNDLIIGIKSPPSDWILYNLTREQRLSMYEKVCEIGRMFNQSSESFEKLLNDTEEQMRVVAAFADRGEKTHLEVMAELRDYKRRRQSYRGKNNMTKKLFFTEVLRDLIEQQMLYLTILYEQQQTESAVHDSPPIVMQHNIEERINNTKSENLESETKSRYLSSEKTRDRRFQEDHRDNKYGHRRLNERQHRDRRRSRSRNRSRSRERSREYRYREKRDRRDIKEISNVTVYDN
ncbi:uncharacterized protein LOC101238746 isoform X1 [Hydra vulgaris]|uniref:uncharacterized protein LOC101238746 isoform X1 n=1 Tax=Hydra vulgaris TaxID=6087 RepID=UPI001F5F3B5F|nr:uncharacterized protein LOC101238746 isoform X1 [Hydra vulgaris]